MQKKIIDVRTFADTQELIEVLTVFQDLQSDHVLFVESDGFYVGGKAELVEEMLSDDSVVYNVRLSQDDMD